MGGGRLWRPSLALIPALAVAALPKCPLCLMALTSALGLGAFVRASWLTPATFALLAVSLGSMALRARRRRLYAPFCLGLVSAAFILAGRLRPDLAPLTYAGLALLVSASLWGARPGRRVARGAGCEC